MGHAGSDGCGSEFHPFRDFKIRTEHIYIRPCIVRMPLPFMHIRAGFESLRPSLDLGASP